MKTSEFLEKAKSYIDSPEKWTQEELAKDAHGKPVNPYNESATCFCSLGALMKAQLPTADRVDIYYTSKKFLFEAMGSTPSRFNDTHTHEEVMDAWDRAIAEAKAEGN